MQLRAFVATSLLVTAGTAGAQDMTVYGIKLGEPFTLTKCSPENINTGCWNGYAKTDPPRDEKYLEILLPTAGRLLHPLLIDGNVEGVSFLTDGIRDADRVLAMLTEKYGKPTKTERRAARNLAGATFVSTFAWWKLPHLRVEFRPHENELTSGAVIIMTLKGQAQEDKESAQRADKNKL